MSKTQVSVTINLEVYDDKQFRQAAYERAISDGLDEDSAKEYLDEETMSLGNCAVMLLDPGISPAGCQIEDSSSDEF